MNSFSNYDSFDYMYNYNFDNNYGGSLNDVKNKMHKYFEDLHQQWNNTHPRFQALIIALAFLSFGCLIIAIICLVKFSKIKKCEYNEEVIISNGDKVSK